MDLFRVSWSSPAGVAAQVNSATKDFGADQTWVARLSTLSIGPFSGPVNTLISGTITRSLGVDVGLAQRRTPLSLPALLETFDEAAPGASGPSAGNRTG